MLRKFLYLLLFLPIGLSLTSVAHTDEAPDVNCTPSEWFVKNHSTHTPYENLDLSERVQMQIRGVPFLVPHGYNGSRFKLEHLEQIPATDGIPLWKTKWGQTRAKFLAWVSSMDWPRFRTTAPVWRDCSDLNEHLIRFWIQNPSIGESVFMETLTDEEINARNGASNPERWYPYPDRKWQNRIIRYNKRRDELLRDPSSLYPEWTDEEVLEKFHGRSREEIFSKQRNHLSKPKPTDCALFIGNRHYPKKTAT